MTLLDAKQLLPGKSAFARLKLDRPLLLFPGDRFILRQYSPVITIGGGRVLDAGDPPIRIARDQALPFLEAIASASPKEALLARVNRRWIFGLTVAEAVAETGWLAVRVQQLAAELKQASLIAIFGHVLITAHWLERVRQDILSIAAQFHDANPLLPGINKEELRASRWGHAELFDGVVSLHCCARKSWKQMESCLHLPGRGVVLRDEEAESKSQIEQGVRQSGLAGPGA